MKVSRMLLGVIALGITSLLNAQTPLRVISFPGGANLPLWVAEDTGLFAYASTSAVTVAPAPNSVVLIQSLAGNEEDIALSAFDNVVVAYQEAARVRPS